MELSKKDRLLFSYLLKILEKLYPEEKERYSLQREAVEEGYELQYDWLSEGIFEDLSSQECEEVLNILRLYRGMIFSFNKLEDNSGLHESDLKFPGYDGNNETKFMLYTEYFIEKLDRYKEIQKLNNGYYNSHRRMREVYDKMLAKYRDLFDDKVYLRDYNKDELVTLLQFVNPEL